MGIEILLSAIPSGPRNKELMRCKEDQRVICRSRALGGDGVARLSSGSLYDRRVLGRLRDPSGSGGSGRRCY